MSFFAAFPLLSFSQNHAALPILFSCNIGHLPGSPVFALFFVVVSPRMSAFFMLLLTVAVRFFIMLMGEDSILYFLSRTFQFFPHCILYKFILCLIHLYVFIRSTDAAVFKLDAFSYFLSF